MIQVEDLTKVFPVEYRRKGLLGAVHDLFDLRKGEKTALENVSFTIHPGEIVGFIGPNGAGKSTAIKILTGVLFPTSGQVMVSGRVPWKERKAHVRQIGVMFGSRGTLWPELPAIESFDLLGCMYGVERTQYRKNLDLLSDMLDIGTLLNRPVRELSLGQRMRCELASVLIHSPRVVFLDEPTIGLDVRVKRRIRDLIAYYNREEGMTFVYTSHTLQEVEEICPRLVILNHGQIAYDGKTEELKQKMNSVRRIRIKVQEEGQLDRLYRYMEEIKGGVGAFSLQQASEGSLIIKFEAHCFSVPLFLSYIGQQYEWVQDIIIEDSAIEEIIANLYEERSPEGKGA